VNDDEFLLRAYKGDEDAFRLGKAIIHIACVWDDLVDRDVPVTNEQINSLMWTMLVEMQLNPFYRKWSGVLQPLIQSSIINWHLSNLMEKEPGLSREIAHVARYSAGDTLIYMAMLIGGMPWALEIGPEFKKRLQKEGFAEYNEEMNAKYLTQG
jgi:hypothetical protein